MGVREIVANKFPGVDTEVDPLMLGAKMMEGEGLMWTNDASNGYGDGSFWKVRPGVRLCTGLGIIASPPVYDLVRLALAEKLGSDLAGPDLLAGLHLRAGNKLTVVFATIGTLPAVTSTTQGLSAGVDTLRTMRITPTGKYHAIIRTGNATNTTLHLIYVSALGGYVPMFVAGPYNPNGSEVSAHLGLAHKDRYWLMKNQHPKYGSLLMPSKRGDPLTYLLADTFEVEALGHGQVQGGYSDGERLYIGKSGEIHYMTGSEMDSFRRVKNNPRYGIAGVRGGAVLDQDVTLVFVTETTKPSGVSLEYPTPRNIGLLTGGQLKVIGDRVLTTIRVGSDASRDTQVQAWSDLRGALLVPKRQTTAAACPALFYSTESGGFWPWSIKSSIGLCCLLETGGTMYVGGGAGGNLDEWLYYFDATLATDNGTSLAAHLASPPWATAKKGMIEAMKITASQTSGGAWTVKRRTPTGYETTGATFTPGATLGTTLVPLPSGVVKAEYINGWKIEPSATSVGGTIYEVRTVFKGDMGD